MSDNFFTIKESTEALLKEKSSKFHAYAFRINSTEEVEQQLEILRKKHLKARHYCYAYLIGIAKDSFRANDDGEPSGTAGRPIMGQIEKLNLTNTLVVVVRYFGGTKLGTSGLIKAYKGAAALALEKVEIEQVFLTSNIQITCTYENIGTIMSIISAANYKITDTIYKDKITINIECRKSELENNIKYIKSKILNRSIEDILEETEVKNVSFDIIE